MAMPDVQDGGAGRARWRPARVKWRPAALAGEIQDFDFMTVRPDRVNNIRNEAGFERRYDAGASDAAAVIHEVVQFLSLSCYDVIAS